MLVYIVLVECVLCDRCRMVRSVERCDHGIPLCACSAC